jgi:hypothetical protein
MTGLLSHRRSSLIEAGEEGVAWNLRRIDENVKRISGTAEWWIEVI